VAWHGVAWRGDKESCRPFSQSCRNAADQRVRFQRLDSTWVSERVCPHPTRLGESVNECEQEVEYRRKVDSGPLPLPPPQTSDAR
jgi:hypothetical protein